MKVYVCFDCGGSYEDCGEPDKAFANEADAIAWAKSRRYYDYRELEVE